MSVLDWACVGVLAACAVPVALFAAYPAALWIITRLRPASAPGAATEPPSVSVLVAVRNGEAVIGDKIRNALAVGNPLGRFQVVVVSDGSTDGTDAVVRSLADPALTFLSFAEHVGKAAALNAGLAECRGEVVVFSDADAILEPGAIEALVRHFDDERVGGVCGQRVIARDGRSMRDAQKRYIRFDSAIKELESRLGRITSNDGKLYAIRRALFQPIPEAVTDDLFVCLSVIRQGYHFVFEPAARAMIRLPSRSPSHEVERRRRIVSRSLRGLGIMRPLLNPHRYGSYALGLLINKVLRRLLPLCLVLVLVATAMLSPRHPAAAVLLAVQGVFYAAALAYPALSRLAGPASRLASVPFYFCVGSWGTLLGVADFLRGRKVARWDPRKADA